MTEINLNVFAKNLDGSENKEMPVGKTVAQMLYNAQTGSDSLKVSSWSFAFFNNDAVKMDDSDVELFKKVVKALNLPTWADAAIQKAIIDGKDNVKTIAKK